MRFVHYGLTSITFEFLTNAVERKCKTFVSKIALFVKEVPMPIDLLVHDFDDSLFTRRATCQTKIAHVLDDYNLALARASRRFQLYQPNYARSCSQEGTYIHTYLWFGSQAHTQSTLPPRSDDWLIVGSHNVQRNTNLMLQEARFWSWPIVSTRIIRRNPENRSRQRHSNAHVFHISVMMSMSGLQ